jgi:TetR/AcrR family transcriptional regulator, mexJK operon transcriptional repressor
MRAAIKLFLAGALGPADRVQETSKGPAKGAQRRRPSR